MSRTFKAFLKEFQAVEKVLILNETNFDWTKKFCKLTRLGSQVLTTTPLPIGSPSVKRCEVTNNLKAIKAMNVTVMSNVTLNSMNNIEGLAFNKNVLGGVEVVQPLCYNKIVVINPPSANKFHEFIKMAEKLAKEEILFVNPKSVDHNNWNLEEIAKTHQMIFEAHVEGSEYYGRFKRGK